MSGPRLALVCSHGRTGTFWLTRVLNKHPDVLAAHGPLSPPLIVNGRPDRYADKRGGVGYDRTFDQMSFDEMVAELREEGGEEFLCRVHAASLAQAYEKLRGEGRLKDASLTNIIRHPVPRSISLAAHWLARHRHSFGIGTTLHLLQMWGTVEPFVRYKQIMEDKWRNEVDLTVIENIFFVMAVLWPTQEFGDLALDYPHYRFENIVRDREIFVSLLGDAFNGALPVSPDYVAQALATERANASSPIPVPKLSPARQFASWRPWQQGLYRIFAEEFKIDEVYRPFGYDFSFLNAAEGAGP